MRECSEHQQEISALLDGEGDPTKVLDVMEHVASCPSCGAFVREVRVMQAALDEVYPVEAPLPDCDEDVLPLERPRRSRARVRWAWGLAAALVASLGLPLLFNSVTSGTPGVPSPDQQVVIRLGEDGDAMTDERFVAMVTQLLRADPVYRNEMFSVLTTIREGGVMEETGRTPETGRSREALGLPPESTVSAAALN